MHPANQSNSRPSACQTCCREVALTFHHLIPRKMHRRAYFKKRKEQLNLQSGIYICRQCHNGIHKTYDEMFLAKYRATLDALLADAILKRHFDWVAKQKQRAR